MRTGYLNLGLIALLLLLALSSCGTGNVGVLEAGEINTDGREGSGVSLDNFEVIRYNADGFPRSRSQQHRQPAPAACGV